jgi:DNA-binding HxlR family transcriptional regulator
MTTTGSAPPTRCWASTLLVVRDLTTGPQRFTDLIDRLAGITPKTLTQRLRDLEADGVVAADRVPGRREVWYRLTPARTCAAR